MFRIKDLLKNIIKSIVLLLTFILSTFIILGVLSEINGFDIVNGEQYIKNSHLLVSVVISLGIVAILNIFITRFNESRNPSSNFSGAKSRNKFKPDKYGFVDDIQNNYVDAIPRDYEDSLPTNFIDEIPQDEKLNRFGSISRKLSKSKVSKT